MSSMMNSLNPNQSRLLALGLLCLSLVIVFLLIYFPAKLLNRHYDDAIASRSDYLQRYRNIIAAGDSIRAALNLAKQSNGRKHFLNNTGAALAASEIQEIAKNLIEANGGKLISMQIAPSKDEDGYQRITVNVQMTGNISAIRQILYTLETMQPYLLVDNTSIRSQFNSGYRRPAPAENAEPDLTAGFDLSGYSLAVEEK
jgi:general secretion pathway protein M